MLQILLLVFLVILLVGVLPTWPWDGDIVPAASAPRDFAHRRFVAATRALTTSAIAPSSAHVGRRRETFD